MNRYQEHMLEPEDIEELVASVQQGEIEPFRQIVLQFQYKLQVYCYHMLGNREDAEDAVQEVFVICHRKIHLYQPSVSFSAWIYRIAYRHCLNVIRNRKGRRRLFDFLVWMHREEPGAPDQSELMERIVSRLTPEDKNLLILRAVEQYPFDEIATMVDQSQAAVRKKYERLRNKVKSQQQKEGVSHETKWHFKQRGTIEATGGLPCTDDTADSRSV